MKKKTGFFMLAAMFPLALLGACNGGGGNSSTETGAEEVISDSEETSETVSESAGPIRIVSTPNPSVFPLLLAMARDPELPVELIPVANSVGIDEGLTTEEGEGLLSMTWVAAARTTNGVASDLTLVSVDFWRGFFELTPEGSSATQFADLVGQNLLLSGPVGSGRDGGPDLLFKAALEREGFDTRIYSESTVTIAISGVDTEVTRRHYVSGDFRIYYLPVMDASPVLLAGTLLDDGDGDTSNDMPASASFMVDPAATGIVMNGTMQGASIDKAIDVQEMFTGYASWPTTQLPLGGMSLRQLVLNDAERAEDVAQLKEAYDQAAYDLMNSSSPSELSEMTTSISEGITTYYGQYGLSSPSPVIAAALTNGDLVYRSDLDVPSVQGDLDNFLSEILETTPPVSFYGDL